MKKILVGLDGSVNAFKALEKGIELAKLYSAELHTVSVEELPHFSETIDEIEEEKDFSDSKFNAFILRAREMADTKSIALDAHILTGHSVKAIIEFIKKYHFDLLIIGFIGNSAIYERVMGSTGHSLVRLAPCSILVVK